MGPGLGWARAVVGLLVASLLVPPLIAAVVVARLLYLPMSGPLPPRRPLADAGITRVVDSDNAEIATFRRFETTLPIRPADIPDVLKQAVVAVEDRRFYSHKGVDPQGLLRAGRTDVADGGYSQGASTITQQLIRLDYTGDESRTLRRKLHEAVLARRLESRLSKDEILYRYLSRVYLGGGAYGVGAAAQSYFRKPVRDLTLAEAALLIGLIPAPTRYNPRTNPAGAEIQRRLVLTKMLEQDRISQDRYDRALAEATMVRSDESQPVPSGGTVVWPLETAPVKYPYFVDYLRRYLIARYGEEKVYRGGLRVEASIDPALQATAEATVAETLKGTRPPLEMSLVTVEPDSGLVRALVGGRDFGRSNVNLALGNCTAVARSEPDQPVCVAGGGGGRQPGSAFKPFTLARALEENKSPEDTYAGPGVYRFPGCRNRPDCTVKNVESGGYGRITLRQATALSVNTVFAQLIVDVGVKDTAELAHRLGLTMINPEGKLASGDPYGPSLTLGAAEVSPLDMAAAFGVFAARGEQYPATPVVKVVDAGGTVLEDNTSRRGRRVLPQDVADEVNQVLAGVVKGGTGRAADFGRDGVAGKTGTSEGFSDAWFVGYTANLSTAVWMGYVDARRPLVDINGVKVVYGGTLPAAAWKTFMSQALATVPPRPFPLPARMAQRPPWSPIPVAPATPPPDTPFATNPNLDDQSEVQQAPNIAPSPSDFGYLPPGYLPPEPPPGEDDPFTVPNQPPASPVPPS